MTTNPPSSIYQLKKPQSSDCNSAHDYINDGRVVSTYRLTQLTSNSKLFTVIDNNFTQSYAKTVFDTMTCLYASTKYSSTPLGYRYNNINYKNMFIDVDIQNYNKKMFEDNTINLKANYINSKNGEYILLNKCPGTDTINEISFNDIVSGDRGYNETEPNQKQNIINDFNIGKITYSYKCFTIMNAYSPVTNYTHENQFKNLSGSQINIRDFFRDFYGVDSNEYRFSLINHLKEENIIQNLNEKYDYWLVSKYFDEEPSTIQGTRPPKYYRYTELIEVIPKDGRIRYKRFKVYDPPIFNDPIKESKYISLIPNLTFEDFCIGNLYKIIGEEKNHINIFIKEMTDLLGLNRKALQFFHIHVGYNCEEKLIILTIHGKYELTSELKHTIIDNINPIESIPDNLAKKGKKKERPIKFNNFLTSSCEVSILANDYTDITPLQWYEHNTYIIINQSGGVTVLKHHITHAIDSNLLGISNFSLNILANQDNDILYAPEAFFTEMYDPFMAGGRKKKSIIKSKYNKKSRKINKHNCNI